MPTVARLIERGAEHPSECEPLFNLNEVTMHEGGTQRMPGSKSMKQRDLCTEDPRGVVPLGAGTAGGKGWVEAPKEKG